MSYKKKKECVFVSNLHITNGEVNISNENTAMLVWIYDSI